MLLAGSCRRKTDRSSSAGVVATRIPWLDQLAARAQIGPFTHLRRRPVVAVAWAVRWCPARAGPPWSRASPTHEQAWYVSSVTWLTRPGRELSKHLDSVRHRGPPSVLSRANRLYARRALSGRARLAAPARHGQHAVARQRPHIRAHEGRRPQALRTSSKACLRRRCGRSGMCSLYLERLRRECVIRALRGSDPESWILEGLAVERTGYGCGRRLIARARAPGTPPQIIDSTASHPGSPSRSPGH